MLNLNKLDLEILKTLLDISEHDLKQKCRNDYDIKEEEIGKYFDNWSDAIKKNQEISSLIN